LAPKASPSTSAAAYAVGGLTSSPPELVSGGRANAMIATPIRTAAIETITTGDCHLGRAALRLARWRDPAG
jgi:hypothetical protein